MIAIVWIFSFIFVFVFLCLVVLGIWTGGINNVIGWEGVLNLFKNKKIPLAIRVGFLILVGIEILVIIYALWFS